VTLLVTPPIHQCWGGGQSPETSAAGSVLVPAV